LFRTKFNQTDVTILVNYLQVVYNQRRQGLTTHVADMTTQW